MPMMFRSISGIVPAAGRSVRMGQDKRLLSVAGTTMLEKSVFNLVSGGCSKVFVVLEPLSPCAHLPVFSDPGVIAVILPEQSPSMLASIVEAVKLTDNEAVAVLPADCPFVEGNLIRDLIQRFRLSRKALFVPFFEGHQGHPRFVARSKFESLTALSCHGRFSLLFEKFRSETASVEINDPRIIRDIDTMDEYETYILKR